MLTLTNTKTRKLKYLSHLLWEYSFYLCQELCNPTDYLISLVIGLLVAWLMQTPSIIPLLVSCIILIAANAIQQFKNSDIEALLLLPAYREDPAFIMDLDGKVVLSGSKTERLFQQESISNIKDIIGRVAALHDIGKVAIPDLIKLPKAYSRDQRLKMQMHTIVQRLCGIPE